MQLRDVLKNVNVISTQGSSDKDVSGLTHDSRAFTAGQIFVAIKGEKYDGHDFSLEAVGKGAVAVVVSGDWWNKFQKGSQKSTGTKNEAGTFVVVDDTRAVLGQLAANFYGHPSREMFLVGVTGTNGKTTTTHMIEALLDGAHVATGVIGTINNHLRTKVWPATHTTPDPLALQKLLSEWKNLKADAVAMEVSSHALAMHRADDIEFDVAVFTNLTRDHLDFHKTMEAYVEAKGRFFKVLLKNSPKKNKLALINIHDPYHKEMLAPGITTWTYGFDEKADLKATNIKLDFAHADFELQSPKGSFAVRLNMTGRHNILNALGAIGVALHRGLRPEQIQEALRNLSGVKGRLERVATQTGIHVFVDYAHSDDALKNVLSLIKQVRDETSPKARIITVFGCGGDRDRGKRPLMRQVASHFSDVVVVTSDNPRTESPGQIIEDILAGEAPSDKLLVEADRKAAIGLAIGLAKKGDVILLAGKGHEDYQIIGTKKFPFDDAKIAADFLKSGKHDTK